MKDTWHIRKHTVSGHIAFLETVGWLDIERGWYLIWIPLEPYDGGVRRLPLPRNWCLIGLG